MNLLREIIRRNICEENVSVLGVLVNQVPVLYLEMLWFFTLIAFIVLEDNMTAKLLLLRKGKIITRCRGDQKMC